MPNIVLLSFQKPQIAPKPQVPPPPPPKPANIMSASMTASTEAPVERPTNLPQSLSTQEFNTSVEGHDESPEKLSLKARLKLFEKEIEQQGAAPAPKTEKKFSFLSDFELAKMKEEEEMRIANMTRAEFAKLNNSTSALEVESAQDKALDDVAEIDELGKSRKVSAPASLGMLHTAKGERRLREKLEREGIECPEEFDESLDESLSPAEKRAKDAERRAAWRKARLKSLENVSFKEF